MKDSPLHLSFKADERIALELELCRRVTDAVSGAEQRDTYLQNWRDQLEGLGQVSTNTRWRGACTYTDPITMEAFLTALSQMSQALHRDPKVAVEAFSSEDENSATDLEHYLVAEGNKVEIEGKLYEAVHNSVRDTAVPIYCGWQYKERKRRDVGYKEQDGRVVSEEEGEDSETAEAVPVAVTEIEEGYDIRVLDLADFYLYPPNAPGVESATLICERLRCTEDDLMDGIEDWGYDKAQVRALIDMGPAALGRTSQYSEQIDDQDGVNAAQGNEGYYELFLVFTRLPRLYGEYELPAHLRQDDFISVLCPAHNIVLKLDFSPFRERPYLLGYILPKVNRYQGYSVPSILEGPQAEANANIRCTIDSMNLTMVPALKVLKSAGPDMNKWSIFPGAHIPVETMQDLEPLEWDRSPLRDGLTWAQDLRNRAQALISAQGQGQLQSKVRKTGEVQSVETAAQSKFGLYLWNFMRTVVGPLYQRMVTLKEEFGGVDEDEGEEYVYEGKAAKITAKALRGKYRFVPTATSLTASPETRIEIGKMKQAVQIEYMGAIEKIQDQSKHVLLWHMARELLLDLGETNPESKIGPEPAGQPPQQQLPPGDGGSAGASAAVPAGTPPQQGAGGNFLQLAAGGAQ